MKSSFWAQLGLIACLLLFLLSPALAGTGETKIAKWHDDKKAVFLLMFDDSWPSQWQVALPALVDRGLIATFYVNPGKGEFLKFKEKWTKDMIDAGMVLGNHTMTHKGVADMADAEQEIGGATKAILEMTPDETPRLLSFAMPGVGPGKWNISKEQYSELLAKHHLIDRPPFNGHGAVYHLQTADQMLALADRAISRGEMEYLVVHGVERREINWGYQDMWPLKVDILSTLLDGLKDRQSRGDLWVTDHISWHCYQAERDHSTVKTLHADDKTVSLELACSLDHEYYHRPLTLVTQIHATWAKADVVQGKTTKTVTAQNGQITFEATPGNELIQIVGSR